MEENVDLKLVIALARAHSALFGKIEKSMKAYDLTISEFGVLELLYHKGTQPVQQIAEKILVTSGTITYIVNKLQEKELVSRKKCEKDKRIFYVELTRTGETLISKVFPEHEMYLGSLLEQIDPEIKNRLVTDLFSMKACVEKQK